MPLQATMLLGQVGGGGATKLVVQTVIVTNGALICC
jgi:hypothetical protein